jgi:hypothetical protein
MKTLSNILYPGTSIWESDVWEKDVISANYCLSAGNCLVESVIPEPKIYKNDFSGTNISSHEHIYPFTHTDEKGNKHTGEVSITHYRLTDPNKHHAEEEGSVEYPGAVDISFSMKYPTGGFGYASVGKEKIPPKTRTAIGSKIKGIVEHHIRHHVTTFAEEMKKEGTPAFLRAEGFEPEASINPKAYEAAREKHIAYGKMFNHLAKKYPKLFHPYKKPEPNKYEDITGFFTPHELHTK